MIKQYRPGQFSLATLAKDCEQLIRFAESKGIAIDDGNVVDLIADNIVSVSLAQIRAALIIAGYAEQFPRALKTYVHLVEGK